MKCEIVKLESLSGDEASIYSVIKDDDDETLFEIFVEENKISFKSELQDIISRIKIIGQNVGAREQYFKKYEGILGDGVCALYDKPNSNLRLYCIRFGKDIVILGGGGHKPKKMRTLQESEKLKEENYLLRKLSEEIYKKIKNGEIWFSSDRLELEGDLTFNDESNE